MKLITLKSVLSGSPRTLSGNNTVENALKTMAELSISSIIIVDESNYPIGIFTEHDALRVVAERIAVETLLSDIMTLEPFCVEESLYLHDAYVMMEEKAYRHLVVVNNEGKFAGVVSEGDFLRHIGFEELGKFKIVAEAMSGSPLIVSLENSLLDAAASMRERKCDYAVVLDGANPVGIIRERDIAHWCAQKDSYDTTVKQLLHRDIRIITKDIPLQEAAALMEEHGIHQLVVVDDLGNLVGLLSRHDVLHAVHGAYFEFLIRVIDEKSTAISKMHERKKELIEQKKAIELSTMKLRKVFEALPDGVLVIEAETLNAVEFNQAAHEQLGYSAEEFAALSVRDYEAIENPEETLRRVKKLQEQGWDTFETIHRKKNGELINVWVNIIAVTLEDRRHFITVFRDITELKKVNDVLMESKTAFERQSNFLHTLLNTIPDLIWLKDQQGVYLACNRMFERFFNAQEKDMLGKTDFDFVNPELAQFFRDHDRAVIDAGDSKINEEYLTFGDGSYEGYFETVKTPIYDSEGAVIGVLGVSRDVSDRKRKDKEIARVEALAKI